MSPANARSGATVWEDVCPTEDRKLSEEHRRVLVAGSGIADAVIEARGYHSLSLGQVNELVSLEVIAPPALKALSWMGIPIYKPDGGKYGEVIRLFGTPDKYKYIWPTGKPLSFDVNPLALGDTMDVSVDAVITEGIKKADALLSAALREGRKLLVVAVNGCDGWRAKIDGHRVASPDYMDIAWEERRTFVISDSDYRTNDSVQSGWNNCALYTAGKTGPHKTFIVVVPPSGLEKQGADDYIVAGNTLESLLGHAQTPRHAALETQTEHTPLKLKSGLQLMRESGSKIPHLVEPLMPEQSITLIAGHTGTYKTWAALTLALDGAFGFDWLGHPKLKTTADPITTMYVNKEMSGLILGQRLKTLARASRYDSLPGWEGIIEQSIHFTDEAGLDLNIPAQRDRLEEAIVATGTKLVVLDSLSMCWHGDENSASEVGAFYTELRGITERTKCSWAIIHHLLKPSSNARKSDPVIFSVRGSGQLIQQADAALILAHYDTEKDESGDRLLTFTHAKARTSAELPAWVTKFSMHDGLWADMVYMNDATHVRAAAYSKSSGDPQKLNDWLVSEFALMPAMQPSGKGLRFKQLVVLLQQSWTAEGDPPSEYAIRTQVKTLSEGNDAVLDLVEESKKHGNLYRLKSVEETTDATPDEAPA